jgi:CheY-like chemotaxis protein
VHGFCVQAGGTARLASTPGKGTTVSLILPADQGRPASPAEAAPDPGESLRGCRLLLVEDNEELGDATEALLDSYGVRILRAGSAEEALSALDAGASVDVLLSDVVMPGSMDGIALALLLRRRWPGLPVVLITGYTRSLEAAQGFTLLRKPCAPDTLVAALAQAMGDDQPAAPR